MRFRGRKADLLSVAAVAATLGLAAGADARPAYRAAIPNGELVSCDGSCHIAGEDKEIRSLFGLDVEPLAIDVEDPIGVPDIPLDEWWPVLRGLDSDGDLQTNAQELGDPCLEWTMAMPAGRTIDLSNPGDELSLSMDPDVCEDPPDPGAGGAGGAGGAEGELPPPDDGAGGEDSEANNADPGAPADPIFNTPKSRSACSLGGDSAGDAWLMAGAMAWLFARRRRRR